MVPTIQPHQKMSAYHFYNNPFQLSSGVSAKWKQEEGLFGVCPIIYPQEVEFTFIPNRFIQRSCRKFTFAWLCDTPIAHQSSCISDLFYNSTTSCNTTKPNIEGAHLVHCSIFLQEPKSSSHVQIAHQIKNGSKGKFRSRICLIVALLHQFCHTHSTVLNLKSPLAKLHTQSSPTAFTTSVFLISPISQCIIFLPN